jgi:hypothetical protein
MKKLLQTRVDSILNHSFDNVKTRDNSYATAIACFLDLDSPEDCIQIQEHFSEDENDIKWVLVLSLWLEERGYDWGSLMTHQYDDSYYLVLGENYMGNTHICIYKNGELWHDPLPGGIGLITEDSFEFIRKNKHYYQ